MQRTQRQIAMVLAGAIALIAASAGAEAASKKSTGRAAVTSKQVQPSNANRSSYGYQPPVQTYDRYNMPPGGGINFNDGRFGANYNPGP